MLPHKHVVFTDTVQRQNLDNEKLKTEKKSLEEDLQKTQVRFFKVTSVIIIIIKKAVKMNTGF